VYVCEGWRGGAFYFGFVRLPLTHFIVILVSNCVTGISADPQDGAVLAQGFSRPDYELYGALGNSVDELSAVLPA
jgi:hypothetical protein